MSPFLQPRCSLSETRDSRDNRFAHAEAEFVICVPPFRSVTSVVLVDSFAAFAKVIHNVIDNCGCHPRYIIFANVSSYSLVMANGSELKSGYHVSTTLRTSSGLKGI